jgi:hypothetical protein
MVTIQLEPIKEQQLQELASLKGQDPAELARSVVEEYLYRSAVGSQSRHDRCLPRDEAQLLLDINRGLPDVTWRRYHDLMDRRRIGTMTPDEHEELKALTDEVELTHARRMEKVAELAKLRRMSLDDVMAELGI